MHQAWLEVGHRGVLGALAAFVLTALLIPNLAPLAVRLGLVDRPGGRKTHAAPTPVVGGLAIAMVAIPLAIGLYQPSPPLVGLGAAAGVLLTAGVLDDLYNLKWVYRLCAQAAAALLMIYVGGVRVEQIGLALGLRHHALGALSAPFTVLATVGLINALNMSDGIDGLAGALTVSTLAMLSAAAIYAGDGGLACGLILMIGAAMAFLAYNFRTPWRPCATVFLGNAGSEFLGLLIAWAAFRLTQNPAHPVNPVLAPFLIAPPVVDCLVLIVRRLKTGRSPFSADRNHIHHLLLEGGFSVSATVLAIVGVSLAVGLAAALAMRAHLPDPLFVAAFLALVGGYYGLTARRERAVTAFGRLASAAAASRVRPAGPTGRPARAWTVPHRLDPDLSRPRDPTKG